MTAKQKRVKAYARHKRWREAHPHIMRDRMRALRLAVPGYDYLTPARRQVLARKRAAAKAARA
jgi:hypothetical protein